MHLVRSDVRVLELLIVVYYSDCAVLYNIIIISNC